MKRVAKPVFFIVLAVILFFTLTAVFGISGRHGDDKITYLKGAQDIRWGIDIRGGVEATFTPNTDQKATESQIDSAKEIIETRLVANNITDYELYTDYNSDRIIVRFPWKTDEIDFDPEAAIDEISATALLTFREGAEYETTTTDANGELVNQTPAGVTAEVIILQGDDIVKAEPQVIQNETTGAPEYIVSLELSSSAAEKFAEATARLKGKPISIWMDEVMISAPTVNEVISDGKCSISGGGFTAAEVSALANKINAGALPFSLKTENFSTINPALGMSSLNAMMLAGIIALVIISLLMIFLYRLPGFVAVISLLGQVAMMFASVSGYFSFVKSFTMTLPGIAGMILSVGMGVDANIISAERIKEEIQIGKSIDSAVRSGFSNSFSAIFDGNITVIIVALILMGVFGPSNILSAIFGASTTGAIYSFGYTLLVGIIANFVMAVFASRLMTMSLSGFKLFRKKWLFGGESK